MDARPPDEASTVLSSIPRPDPDTPIAGRYQIGERVGKGGAGDVYEAVVVGTNRRVAVKILRANEMTAPARVRREVAALRLLRLPGIVSLLDHGTWEGRTFLVMEFVEGQSFPGSETPLTWDVLAPLTRSLLEALARVHAAGIVHRDIKPSNVLVGPDGRVTILDFGISFGPALGERVTQVGTLLGTPEYLAPEQICGDQPDARADLYAVGTMLFDALVGETPFAESGRMEIVRVKMRSPAPLLRHRLPNAPVHVADVVDALLAVDRDRRPRSAGEVLRRLFATDAAFVQDVLPRLGGRDAIDEILTAVREGRRVAVTGLAGTGRTRLLRDVAAELLAEKRPVLWVTPGTAPYSGLRDVIDDEALSTAADADQAHSIAAAALRTRLADGTVLLMDDPERVDRWTRRAVYGTQGAGAAVVVGDEPADTPVRLWPLAPADLEPLFAGPRRILHLPEDAARELWERTGGLARRVADEIGAWCRAGLAHWEGGVVHVPRKSLDQLRVGGRLVGVAGPAATPRIAADDDILACANLAWPHASMDVLAAATAEPRWLVEERVEELEQAGVVRRLEDGRVQPLFAGGGSSRWPDERRRRVHRAIAETVPEGGLARLRHFAEAHDERAVAASEHFAEGAYRNGHLHDAIVTLEVGLAIAREHGDSAGVRRLLAVLVPVCLSAGSRRESERALYELDRSARDDAEARGLRTLLRCTGLITDGREKEALHQLDDLNEFDDMRLELWRNAQRLRAAYGVSQDEVERVLALADRWARRSDDDGPGASIASWRATAAKRHGNDRASIPLLQQAAESTDRIPARIASLLHLAELLIDNDEMDRGHDAALAARDLAADVRHTHYEAIASNLLRRVPLRRAEPSDVDDELLEAITALGAPRIDTFVSLTEACFAWRAGAAQRTRELALRARRLAEAGNIREVPLLAQALDVTSVSPPERDVATARALGERAVELAPAEPAVAFQVLGVLAHGFAAEAAGWREQAQAILTENGPLAVRRRFDVLSVAEVLHGMPDRA